jgi:hypothetical protein
MLKRSLNVFQGIFEVGTPTAYARLASNGRVSTSGNLGVGTSKRDRNTHRSALRINRPP